MNWGEGDIQSQEGTTWDCGGLKPHRPWSKWFLRLEPRTVEQGAGNTAGKGGRAHKTMVRAGGEWWRFHEGFFLQGR